MEITSESVSLSEILRSFDGEDKPDDLKFVSSANKYFDDDIQAAKEKKRAKIHAKRLEMCGSWCWRFDPHTGRPERYIYKCGLWRDGLCKRCLEERAEWARGSMKNIVIEKKIKKIEIEKNTAKRLIRKMKKEQYERFPIDDDMDLLFFDATALEGDSRVDEAQEVRAIDVIEMDWEKVVDLPEGRNKSGSLSTPKSSDGEDFAMVQIEDVISTADHKVEEEIAREVMRETPDLNPETPQEVEKAIARRTALFKVKLVRRGYSVFFHKRRVRCHISRISWLNRTYTEKMTSQNGDREEKKITIPC